MPFNYFEGKKLTGFEVDLMNAIAEKMGLKTEWQALPFDSLFIGLEQDRYDVVIASHAVTPDRAKSVRFLAPHFCSGPMMVSRPGGPKKATDLSGKTVAVQVGTTYLQIAKKITAIRELKTYPKDSDALQSILSGKVDAWITDRFGGMELIKKVGAGRLESGELLSSEAMAGAVALSAQTLAREMNLALASVLKNGTYTTISQKYFGTDIRCH